MPLEALTKEPQSDSFGQADYNQPSMSQREKTLIMLVSGNEDYGKRATLAFSAACTALAMEQQVTIFLVGDGSFWAGEKSSFGIEIPGFPPLNDLFETFGELGGRVALCSTCAKTICGIDEQKNMIPSQRRSCIEIQGFASVLSEAQHSTTLTF